MINTLIAVESPVSNEKQKFWSIRLSLFLSE